VRPPRRRPGGRSAVSRQDAKIPSNVETKALTTSASDRRAVRYDLREALWTHSDRKRLRMCGRCRASGASQPTVRVADGVAHFTNVQTCGSIWSCPVCGPKVRQERAIEIDQAMQRWLDRSGGAVLFLTLTMPHDFGDDLDALFRVQKAAWGRIFSGRAWQDEKAQFGLLHWIRSWDCTHGVNGWHPHAHAVLFASRTPTAVELEAIERRFHARWASAVEERGYRRPTRENGIKLELARTRADLAAYVAQLAVVSDANEDCKVALEVARTDLKLGRKGRRTPFEILAAFAGSGDYDQLLLWREWESATHGKHAIQWSRGLRALLEIDERTDEEIAAEEVGGETVYTFAADEWVAVCRVRRGQSRVLAAAELQRPGAIAVCIAQILQEFSRERKRQLRAPPAEAFT